MGIEEYAEWARRAGGEETTADASDAHVAILAFSLLGDASEVGEVVKRRLRDGRFDRERLAYELSDVIYYWARLCAVADVRPSTLLERSRRSIEERLAKRAKPAAGLAQ